MSRILIVGGGYIGLYAARHLERLLPANAHQLVMVSPENHMTYQPFLPEVASGLIDPRAVVVPLRSVLRRTELIVGEVERIEVEGRSARIRLPDGRRRDEPFDVAVIGAGSWSRTLPIPGLAEYAVGFKTLPEAIWLRNRVLAQLDAASEAADAEERRTALGFVFVGAGFAGIEAIGELEDFARAALAPYPGGMAADMRWLMVEASDRILPELDPALATYAADRLRERGIEIRTETKLVSIEDGLVRLSDGSSIAAGTVVWTAGVRASPLASASGLPSTAAAGSGSTGRSASKVSTVSGAAGDVAAVPELDEPSGFSPPTAQHALRQAKRLAENIAADLDGRPLQPFRYRNKGMLCSLGHYQGVADPLGVRIRGFPAWFLHRTYHLFYMPTLGRKVRIALDWTVALLFPRDLAQLGSLEHPRDAFRRSAGS
jgi:NADH dehydrogenase, FAD-containing subunit